MAGHRFPRDIILFAVRYYLQSGAAAERIAGILADRGIDVSGRTILRWVQKFGPALSDQIRPYRTPLSATWLIDETYVKILGKWHYLYRGVDLDGQVPDCWLSGTRDLPVAEALSSDAPSHPPVVHQRTSSPIRRASTRTPSAPGPPGAKHTHDLLLQPDGLDQPL